ncbi:MAG: imidazolonepropionase [Myxococcaceae bacterium]|nr:imidazolonepropionase [Myxococcaceae bacterium]
MDLVVRNTSELVTCDGPLGGRAEETLGRVARGVVGVQGGRISFLGPEEALPTGAITATTRVIDAQGGFVGPGLVDCHTHVVFAGDRSDEFEQRCQGKSYLEIAAAGGGIAKTVLATRGASVDDLVRLARPRLDRLLRQGVTTVEIKSGYGLDAASERRLLDAIATLGRQGPQTVVSTFLGLHAVPKELGDRRSEWVQTCLDLLDALARERRCDFVDAFVEQSAFTHDEARQLAARARAVGVPLRLHVDQLTANSGAQLAASLEAVTADHLEQITPEGVAALARAGTIAVLAPTSTLFARARPFAPGRALRDAGVQVALCTNCNPGSSNSENVSLAMGLACLENGLTPAEAFLGFTRIGALALRRPDLGRLTVGGPADLVVFAAESYRTLPYHLGMNEAAQVMKAGQVV